MIVSNVFFWCIGMQGHIEASVLVDRCAQGELDGAEPFAGSRTTALRHLCGRSAEIDRKHFRFHLLNILSELFHIGRRAERKHSRFYRVQSAVPQEQLACDSRQCSHRHW